MENNNTKIDSYITCAFINAESKPIKESEWISFSITETKDGKNEFLSLNGTKYHFYPHPDAPENAFLQVFRELHIKDYQKDDPEYPIIYMALQSQKALKEIIKRNGL